MIMDVLVEQNPWWSSRDLINQDPYVVAFDRSRVKWVPNVFNIIDFSKDLVYSLRGPRQIGKTTIVKLLIRKLIESGIDPRNILYFSCESIGS